MGQPILRILTVVLIAFLARSANAGDIEVVVTDAYLDLRTGPGRGFPVFHSAARDTRLRLEKQRTAWIQVTTDDRREISGWIHERQLSQTSAAGREEARYTDQRRPYPRFEWAVSGGDFAGASGVSTSLAFNMTRHLSLRATGTQVLGDFSNGWLATGTIRHQPFPGWRLSPWFELGGGLLATEPFSTIVQADDRKDNVLTVGAGMDVFVARRFTVFMDFHRHTVLTSRDVNEEINEWKLGIKVSF